MDTGCTRTSPCAVQPFKVRGISAQGVLKWEGQSVLRFGCAYA